MIPRDFLTVFNSFEDLETIKLTLPSIVEETVATGSALVVHDCSVRNRAEIRRFIEGFECDEVFVVFSSRLDQARSRNLALDLGRTLYAPEYIASIEDDHGYRPGFIPKMIEAMKTYYGKPAPTGMKFGLFTGCLECWKDLVRYEALEDGNLYPVRDGERTGKVYLGGVNACCRVAPVRHWDAVLGRFDTDEYPVSGYQPSQMNLRNYHNGFTGMVIDGGNAMFSVDRVGRGVSQELDKRPYHPKFTKSDPILNHDPAGS